MKLRRPKWCYKRVSTVLLQGSCWVALNTVTTISPCIKRPENSSEGRNNRTTGREGWELLVKAWMLGSTYLRLAASRIAGRSAFIVDD